MADLQSNSVLHIVRVPTLHRAWAIQERRRQSDVGKPPEKEALSGRGGPHREKGAGLLFGAPELDLSYSTRTQSGKDALPLTWCLRAAMQGSALRRPQSDGYEVRTSYMKASVASEVVALFSRPCACDFYFEF